jgi:hypothetical protein
MVENPIVGPKFEPLFYAQLHVTASVFHIISMTDSLALWNEYKAKDNLDIEESDEHCLHL